LTNPVRNLVVACPARKGGDGAPGVELTPAMIEAGVEAYRACDRDYDPDERVVSEVFQAMAAAVSGCRWTT
jgi:hypothetical protein